MSGPKKKGRTDNDGADLGANNKFAHLHFFFYTPNKITATMSDSEKYAIDSSDAGAATEIPMEAGQIKKGG